MSTNTRHVRVTPETKKMIDDLIKKGEDKKQKRTSAQLLENIMRKVTFMNNNGAIYDIFLFAISAIIVVMMFAVFIYIGAEMQTTLETLGVINGRNMTADTQNIFGGINSALGTLRWFSYLIIFAVGLSILISNFLIKANPVFFIVYIFAIVGAVVASAYISNTYDTLLTNSVLGGTLQSFSVSNFIIAYLPMWVTVIGFLGAIILFINLSRDPGGGGSVI